MINASIRVTSWADLFGSAYGQLILAKAAATLVLGGIGFMHRPLGHPAAGRPGRVGRSARRVLWQLVLVELIIMGATSGIAVALGRSAPPQPTTFAPDASPAFILSGYELPPELTPRPLAHGVAAGLALGRRRALRPGGLPPRRAGRSCTRGDTWSWFRTVNWVVGLVVLTYITSGAAVGLRPGAVLARTWWTTWR